MSETPHSDSEVRESVVDALCGMLRLTPDYLGGRLTDETIERNLEPAKGFVRANGLPTDSVDDQWVIGRVKMLFTIYQAEAAKLDGREGDHEEWLANKKAELFKPHGYWDNYRRLLETRIKADRPVRVLDESTDQVLASFENPARPGQWDRRGLVMGHVQSGKTNHYCGLIAKGVDAGYKLIVVLAGTFNNLRAQTQYRIDEALIGRDTTRGPDSVHPIGVGHEAVKGGIISLTSATENGDFRAATAGVVGFDFGAVNVPTVLVIKKNVTILRNLHEWIKANAPIPEGHTRVAGIPLLTIDDEADSASINTANSSGDPEVDPTKTNLWIRKILNTFDQTAFVGYTATPFANIFIDEQAHNEDVGEDLFPRSFIFSLEPPTNWIGPEKFFGITNDADDEEVEWPLTNDVLDNEDWLPPKHRKDLVVQRDLFPESLQEAIRSFVLSCAARRARGQAKDDMSMLVHVTTFVNTQEQVRDQVADKLHVLKNQILYDYSSGGDIQCELERIWNRDFLPATVALDSTDDPLQELEFADVEAELKEAVGKIEVRMINGRSTDSLDYARHPEGLAAIVVGGAKLSRGLTLEGLSVSYYLRATRMYDTLMQMGRWFGYRPGYRDLCRIYTTPEIMVSYRNIVVATRELLDDFKQMQAEGGTPADFGLRVKHSPGMEITARSKIRHGTRRWVSYSDTRPETTSFEIEPDRREKARDCLESFLADLQETHGPKEDGASQGDHAWKDVSPKAVVSFLRDLRGNRLFENSRAVPGYLANYIADRSSNGALTRWTVLVKGNSQDTTPETVAGLEIGRSTRRHNGSSKTERYSVKGLIGSVDEAFDLTPEQVKDVERQAAEDDQKAHGRAFRAKRSPKNGLLILYLLRGEGIEGGGHIDDGPPFMGYCLSLPRDPNATAVEYMVNNVYDQQQLFNE
jgi:hypothetical protein